MRASLRAKNSSCNYLTVSNFSRSFFIIGRSIIHNFVLVRYWDGFLMLYYMFKLLISVVFMNLFANFVLISVQYAIMILRAWVDFFH